MGIQGKKKTELTKEGILSLISSYDIFKRWMPNSEWKLNSITYSPFREEKNPSFIVGDKYEDTTFIDFTSGQKGDCFKFVQYLYNLSTINDVLLLIDKEFSLGIIDGNNTQEYKKIISQYKQPEELGKRYSLIQCITRKFTNEELSYWNSYGIDKQELLDNNIYSLKKVYLNKQLFPLKDVELRFGYLYGTNWKIYRPLNDKKNKWSPNNVPSTAMDGLDDIRNCEIALINKSKKDFIIIKKIFPCSCAVQNENISCFSNENIEYLKSNSKRQILSFDSDIPGVTNSQQITKAFGFSYINVPKKYLSEGIKDWSDLARKYSIKTIEEIFKQKKLL